MPTKISLEVCANSVTSALAAQDGGAVRIELCENLLQAGTTPSCGQIGVARKLLHIELYVLIRPRAGDFLYTDTEFEIMMADVATCVDIGCDGIVIGILNADGTVDKIRCAKLIHLAKQAGLGVTFHRAFDVSADYYQALEDIIELGCDRILTSGGKTTAMEGAANIIRLMQKAAGRIKIMAGSGIEESNVANLVHYTGVAEIHSSAGKQTSSGMVYINREIMGKQYDDLYNYKSSDLNRVKNLISKANS